MHPAHPPYHAPWWLPNAHLQTLYAYFFARKPRVIYRRERIELADGDFLDLDWIDGDNKQPLVVMFHGLEGSSNGHYARALMHALARHGWRGVVANFRGCSGEPNRLARAYHSGDSAEIHMVLTLLRARFPDTPLYAAGVSLGANALLKWLGESGNTACNIIDGAAALSPPFDLSQAAARLDRGFNRRTYTYNFLRTLRRKALDKIASHRLPLPALTLKRARTFREFDERFTAPLHGFRGAEDYWRRASCKPWLNSIAVPTLIVHARNDPFLPDSAIPTPAMLSPAVKLELSDAGGHVGFVSGPFPGRLDWWPRRVVTFFEQHSPSTSS